MARSNHATVLALKRLVMAALTCVLLYFVLYAARSTTCLQGAFHPQLQYRRFSSRREAIFFWPAMYLEGKAYRRWGMAAIYETENGLDYAYVFRPATAEQPTEATDPNEPTDYVDFVVEPEPSEINESSHLD